MIEAPLVAVQLVEAASGVALGKEEHAQVERVPTSALKSGIRYGAGISVRSASLNA